MSSSFQCGEFVFAFQADVPGGVRDPWLLRRIRCPTQGKRQRKPIPGPLGERFQEVAETRWTGMRSAQRNESQGRIAVRDLQAVAGIGITTETVAKAHLQAVVRSWAAPGPSRVSPATIRLRLNCLSAMGVNVKGCRPRKTNDLKWWLNEEAERIICASLRADGSPPALRLAWLTAWTTATGLRIEESLRLTAADIIRRSPTRVLCTVSGTKTNTAQATIVLSVKAILVLDELAPSVRPGQPLFGLTYRLAQRIWRRHREALDLPNPRAAQLKALRRSAARHIHGIKGMPLDQLRQYLRHESVQTTMGYLRLTGGYNEEEQAKWL